MVEKRKKPKIWTDDEIEFIKNNYMTMTDKEIGKAINVPKETIGRKRQTLKLTKSKTPKKYTYEIVLKTFNTRGYELISTEYINGKSKLKYICPRHQDKGIQEIRFDNFQQGQGCYYCGIENSHNKAKLNYLDIKHEFDKRNFTLISKEYVSARDYLQYICNKHKEKGIQKIRYYNLKNGYGCKYCGIESMVLKQSKSHSEFLSDLDDKYKEYDILCDYKNLKTKIKLRHKKCGYIWNVLPSYLLAHKQNCPNCMSNVYKGESRIQKFLEINNIIFKKQYKFSECKNKQLLPFDFVIFNNDDIKCLIEYDGEQHYKPVNFGGISDECALAELSKTKKNDKIKDNFCKTNNIELIRIPYWEFKNIEDILYSHLHNK